MGLTIAIHPDNYTNPATPEKCDASSPRWAELLQNVGHKVRWVDVRQPDILDQLRGCQGFMWRWAHFGGMRRIARRLLPVIEKQLGLAVYPDQNTCWHYDDKIAQAYLLKAVGIPTPQTWIWFDREGAKEWSAEASYPLVLKLAAGAGSTNVRLIHTPAEAARWVDRLFDRRLVNLQEEPFLPLSWKRRIRPVVRILLRGTPPNFPDNGYDPQSGYVLFQEFLPGNEFDTRVTVIGNRAFAYRRFNRPDDFRASGSGNFSVDPEKIDPSFIQLGFKTASAIKSKSCAIDGLYKQGEGVVGEISYTYVSWVVHACPGYWELTGAPDTDQLRWVEGPMWPEEAQIEDFLRRLQVD